MIAAILLLAGCSSTLRNAPLIGEPAYAPPPPAHSPDFPLLGGRADTRSAKPMTAAERAQAEAELRAAAQRAAEERRQQIQSDSR